MLRICAAFVLTCLPLSVMEGLVAGDFTGRVQVIDADTWDVGRERVRIFGIDAPEMDQLCQNPQGQSWACGVWASEQVRQRYGGHKVACERLGQDRYGRTVARCFLNDRDVAREIVSAGLAFAYRRYSTDYVLDEKGAAVNVRGLHASNVQSPSEFRAARVSDRQSDITRDHDCTIKGNISSKGAHIYHVPSQYYYERTRISTAKGERWFCTEAQARTAGWRRSRR